jgi:hypothetical protein
VASSPDLYRGHRRPVGSVLFRVYAKFLSDGDEAANAKISARLGQHQ